jgi:uncharacterized UBP type Zn finger protein
MAQVCGHLKKVVGGRRKAVKPSTPGCKECLERGDGWVHLRLCLQCGHVGCCDSSPNRHATAHFNASRHPVIKSFEPGEDWAFCYLDDEGVDAIPAFPEESPSHHISPAEVQP